MSRNISLLVRSSDNATERMGSAAVCPHAVPSRVSPWALPGEEGFEERLAPEVMSLRVFLGCLLIQLVAHILFMFP